jgi:tyrosine-protein kinase Etk/Wzc
MAEPNTEFDLPILPPKPVSSWILGPKDFLFKYLHYLPWILICGSFFLILAYLKVRFSTPIFRVQSSILVKNEQEGGGGGHGNPQFDDLFNSEGSINLNNEVQVLKSRPMMERVVKDLKLQTYYYNTGRIRSSLVYPNPPFTLEALRLADSTAAFECKIVLVDTSAFLLNQNKTPMQLGQPFEIRGNLFRIQKNQNVDFNTFGTKEFKVGWRPAAIAAEDLLEAFTVGPVADQSTILTLSFTGENTSLGRDILNTLMAVYDTVIIEDKNRLSTNTLHFIDKMMYELSDTLRHVEGSMTKYIIKNQAFDIDEQSRNFMTNIGEDSKERDQLNLKMSVINWMLNYIGDKKNIYELVPTNLGVEEPALGQLIVEYNRVQLEREANLKTTKPDNPLILAMNSALEKIRRNIYQVLENVKQAYLISGESLDKRQEDLQGHISALPGKSMQLLTIQRQRNILEELYSFLLQKRMETSISSASTISNSRLLEPAMNAGVLVSPDIKKIYTLYLMLGILIPVGIASLIELLRDKVSNRMDVEKHTSAPILGEIGHSNSEQTLIVTTNSRKLIAEQFRIVRTNLQYMVSKKEKQVIMITSSFSGEGKSFVSTNMGAVMALTGKRTVIMEFDIRKPKIISGLELKRKMGITNFIIGKSSFEDLLIKVEGIEDLYVIPCGPIPPNPSELLLDPRLDELMQKVKEEFDVVIMDTAPVGLVSDAVNLGRFADCTIYIIREGHTFRKQVSMIDQFYVQKKLPRLCLLLNDIKPQRSYYGGYYGGYGYSGSYGYGSESSYFEDESREGKGGSLLKWIKRSFKKVFG